MKWPWKTRKQLKHEIAWLEEANDLLRRSLGKRTNLIRAMTLYIADCAPTDHRAMVWRMDLIHRSDNLLGSKTLPSDSAWLHTQGKLMDRCTQCGKWFKPIPGEHLTEEMRKLLASVHTCTECCLRDLEAPESLNIQ